MRIHGDRLSGNCYKVLLTAELLDLDYEWVPLDVVAGDTQQPAFLAKNPVGKMPLLELDDSRCLSESNAIVNFLAEGSALMPTDAFARAKVQQWQFFEQYSHEPFIAVARFIKRYLGMPEERRAEFEGKQAGGHKALAVMEHALSASPFLVGDSATAADISLFGYTHVADEGGFELSGYPAVSGWIERVRALPGFVEMEQT